jgi:hypothetical protein
MTTFHVFNVVPCAGELRFGMCHNRRLHALRCRFAGKYRGRSNGEVASNEGVESFPQQNQDVVRFLALHHTRQRVWRLDTRLITLSGLQWCYTVMDGLRIQASARKKTVQIAVCKPDGRAGGRDRANKSTPTPTQRPKKELNPSSYSSQPPPKSGFPHSP